MLKKSKTIRTNVPNFAAVKQTIVKMKRQIFLLLAFLVMLPIGAQIRGNSIVVTVEPDHQDWNYCVGETASFTVEVRRSGTLINDVSIDYAAGPEMYQDVKKSLTLKEGKMKLSGKMSQPGFYRVDVTAHVTITGPVQPLSHPRSCNPRLSCLPTLPTSGSSR